MDSVEIISTTASPNRLAFVLGMIKTGASMDKTIRKFNSFDEMKDEEYRYWASVTPAERFAAGHQFSVEGYRSYGYSADGTELKRVAVRIEQAPR